MKVTIAQLLNSEVALDSLGAMPIKSTVSFLLSRVIRSVKKEITLYRAEHQKLLQRLAVLPEEEKNKAMQKWEFETSEAQAEFQDEYSALLSSEVEIPTGGFTIGQFKDVTVPANIFVALEWLIHEQPS